MRSTKVSTISTGCPQRDWTATWSFAGYSGVLRELTTTETIEDFEVRQIQAVVISGRS